MPNKFSKYFLYLLIFTLLFSSNFFIPNKSRTFLGYNSKEPNFALVGDISECRLPEKVQDKIEASNTVPLKLLVKFKNNPEIYSFSYSHKSEFNQSFKNYQQDAGVEIVEKDVFYKISYIPNDPAFYEQWGFKKVRAPQAWDLTKGSPEIVIAVLDTGIDLDHPDLKDNIWQNKGEIPNDKIDNDNNGYIDDLYGWDFVLENNNPQPNFNYAYNEAGIHHGTLIAGIIAGVGDNIQGISGVSYNSKIMSLKVLDNEGLGDTESVVRAVNYAIDKKVDVIHMSFVGYYRSELLYEALKRAEQAGIVIVAAAGNDNAEVGDNLDETPMYPVCFDENDKKNFIIGVAALDTRNRKTEFSNFGAKCVDISAPGTRVYSTLVYNPEEGFTEYYGGYWSGTSVAAPLISGTIALMKSVNSQISVSQIEETILKETDKIDQLNSNYVGKLGQGCLNTYKAVKSVYLNMKTSLQARYILTGAGEGSGPQVRLFRSNSLAVGEFFAYNENFYRGINITAGDVNGDKEEEIITGANQGGGPQVRIFAQNGKLISQFFAFDQSFSGGINVAAGDLNGDGKDEIVVAPQSKTKGGSRVRVFDYHGNLKSEFLAYRENFKGGISLAIGNIVGDKTKEIITGPLSYGGPQVRVFDISGNVKLQFFAYLKSFSGGIKIAAGNVQGDSKDEIIVSIASVASPYVRVFDSKSNLLAQFLAYQRDFFKGVNLAVGDLDGNGLAEIITGPGVGGGPQVRIFDYQGNVKSQFFAYSKDFRGGISVGTVKAKEE